MREIGEAIEGQQDGDVSSARERKKMRDGDDKTPWVMADGYSLRSADNEKGRMKDEDGKGQNGRFFFFF